MNLRSIAALSAGLLVCVARNSQATSTYFDQLRFTDVVNPGTVNTTSQQWDSLNGASTWVNATPTAGDGNFLFNSNPTALDVPTLTMSDSTTLTPYFFGGGTGTGTINNYGGPTGTTIGGNLNSTTVYVQLAGTQGATGTPFEPTGITTPFNGVSITANGLNYQPTSTVLIDSRPNAAGFGFPFNGTTYTPNAEQYLYTFTLPWTGNFTVGWTMQYHTVFEALRVDTQLTSVNSENFGVGDVNHDRVVDQLDLNLVNSHWQQTDVGLAFGDANLDGVVDQLDLNEVNSHWQQTTTARGLSVVPEPTALSVLGLVSIALFGRRRS